MVDGRLRSRRQAARMMARVLAGGWRREPPPLHLSPEELNAALPLIARTRVAALCWQRLQSSGFANDAAVEALRDAYRHAALEAALHEARLSAVVGSLRALSIEPILFKGWDLARLYPQPGLRVYEDLDLIVPAELLARAKAAPQTRGSGAAVVDFDHAELYEYDAADWEGLYHRSTLVDCAGIKVRVLCAEDRLRAVCLHGLKHCFSNPMWLCDVAVCVEAAGVDFDWKRCFGDLPLQRQWIGCAIRAARDLLGCDVPEAAAIDAGAIPRWLVPTILDMWVRWATAGLDERMLKRELARNPASVGAIVARRWPNQLEVSLRRKAPLVDDPAWLVNLHAFRALFTRKRLREALLREEPQRSTP